MMFDWIYALPIYMLAALAAIAFVGAYWVGCILVRPLLRIFISNKDSDNNIVGIVLSAFGVLYGLLLSLIAVAAYQNLSDVEVEAAAEASAILALYRDASELDSELHSDLTVRLRDYCEKIIVEEWPVMRSGRVPLGAGDEVRQMRYRLLAFEPETRPTELIQASALKHFDAMTDHGRKRRYAAQSGIPTVMWYVVIVGTIINFALMWLFDMRLVTQLFLGGLLAFFLGALILLIAVLERPYRSVEFGVSPQPYQFVAKIIDKDIESAAAATAQASEDN